MLSAIARQVLDQEGVTVADVDWFVPHQANRAIMVALADELGMPTDKMISVIEHTGNIIAGTLPYALDAGTRSGRFQPGDLVLMTTGGAGYSAGAALYRVPER
jgi:3-oxoacyl-[acyl-carrier-protein] synthase-3